ncbi:MAG: hypothetical protein DLM68_10745 [Hyphomicrobiales bacterium]|nr:MAG: hypothetical protein DLM68_10745 [Hyphomicrobiales bacterium]
MTRHVEVGEHAGVRPTWVPLGAAGILGIILALLPSPIEAARKKPAPIGVGSRQPPIPQPRPTLATPAPNESSSEPAPAPPQRSIQTTARDEQDVSKRCLADLETLGVKFAPAASQRLDSRCPVVTPIDVSSLETPAGRIAFPDKPTFNCTFALQFAGWLSNVAAPLVRVHAGSDLATVTTGPGYVCRGRDGDPLSQDKISEHASGDAVDITSLGLIDKRHIAIADVADESNPNHRLLMALRPCGYFTTVLGPGANAAHANHYHLDLGVHGNSASYRICE